MENSNTFINFHEFDDHYVEIKDFARYNVTARYWDVNPNRKKHTVLLLHGVGGALEIWAANVKYLARNYRVIAFDFPGHGKTDFINDISIYNTYTMVEFVKKFIESINLTYNLTLVSHSVGGMVATYFAIKYPEKLKRLILVSSAGFGRNISVKYRYATLKPIGEIGFTKIYLEYLKHISKSNLSKHEFINEQQIDILYSYLYLTSGKGFLYSIRNEANYKGLKNPFRPDELMRITVPTLVFWGEHDESTPITHLKHALQYIPDVRGVVFTDCDHRSHIKKFEDFNKLCCYFIDHNNILEFSEGQKCISI